MAQWSFRKVLALLVAGNLVLGGALLTLRPPQAANDATAPPPALPPQIQELQHQIAQGRSGEPFSLTLSNHDLTDLARHTLAQRQDIPFSGVTIAVANGMVVVDGTTSGLAVTLPVRVTGTVGAQDGKPWARADAVSLGRTPLPGFVRDQILQEVNASLDLSRQPLPVIVDALELRDGEMTIRGTVK